MNYCSQCGTKLIFKELEHEGLIPYCPTCNLFRFKTFNTAVSMVITTKSYDQVLLIEQYNKKRYILVAGYINQKESAEAAAIREIQEEVGLSIEKLIFQKTEFYEKSNTLMINFIAIAKNTHVNPNYEIDSFSWFSLEEAKKNIAKGSLAEKFFLLFYEKVKNNEI